MIVCPPQEVEHVVEMGRKRKRKRKKRRKKKRRKVLSAHRQHPQKSQQQKKTHLIPLRRLRILDPMLWNLLRLFLQNLMRGVKQV